MRGEELSIKQELINIYDGKVLSDTGDNQLNIWLDCYRGESFWINGYNLSSLNLGSLIPHRLAQKAIMELKTKINDDDLDQDYQRVIENISQITEYGLALGGIILKPYPTLEGISVDVVTPDMYIPIDVDNFGKISRILFLDRIERYERGEQVFYTRVEEHSKNVEEYIITNKCYKSNHISTIGREVDIETVDIWSEIESMAITNIDYNLYGYFKNPQANNLDLKSPLGVSCFSRALSLMQDADEQYNRLLWEFQSKETAIDADITMFKGGVDLPKHGERLFRQLNVKDDFYNVFSPNIRDESLINGLNEILKKIEDICGLSRGSISEVNYSTKTAAEIIASKQTFYSTVTNIQKNLQTCLKDTVKAMAYWSDVKSYEVSFEWDDSILTDSDTERKIRLEEVAAGLMKPETYLAWRYGISEEEAIKRLPDVKINEVPNDYDLMEGV